MCVCVCVSVCVCVCGGGGGGGDVCVFVCLVPQILHRLQHVVEKLVAVVHVVLVGVAVAWEPKLSKCYYFTYSDYFL